MISGATMTPNHPNCRCVVLTAAELRALLEREIAPRAIARQLPCFGGPWDGERKLLEADESEILLAGEGRYVAVASKAGELLRWRSTG
jgi:hypothetical protein